MGYEAYQVRPTPPPKRLAQRAACHSNLCLLATSRHSPLLQPTHLMHTAVASALKRWAVQGILRPQRIARDQETLDLHF